jgi:ankyrin repeat protein
MSEQPPPAGQKTELHFACCRGDPKLIIEAVKKGISINALDDKQCSPLHVAARYNHTEVCRFLMSQGADMSLQDSVSWRLSSPPPTSRPCPPVRVLSKQTRAARRPIPTYALCLCRRGGPRHR